MDASETPLVDRLSPSRFSDRQRSPTLREINAIAPHTPVYILFVYTSALVNAAALRALGIDKTTSGRRSTFVAAPTGVRPEAMT